jgi:hypothetical protein
LTREREEGGKRMVTQLTSKKILRLFYLNVESSISVYDFAVSAKFSIKKKKERRVGEKEVSFYEWNEKE